MGDEVKRNQNVRDDIAAELIAEDDEVGELIDTEHFSSWDSEIAPGDLVFFRLRHRAFRFAPKLPEMVGLVKYVLGGHELIYMVEVVSDGELPWHDLIVRRGDIVKVFPKVS